MIEEGHKLALVPVTLPVTQSLSKILCCPTVREKRFGKHSVFLIIQGKIMAKPFEAKWL